MSLRAYQLVMDPELNFFFRDHSQTTGLFPRRPPNRRGVVVVLFFFKYTCSLFQSVEIWKKINQSAPPLLSQNSPFEKLRMHCPTDQALDHMWHIFCNRVCPRSGSGMALIDGHCGLSSERLSWFVWFVWMIFVDRVKCSDLWVSLPCGQARFFSPQLSARVILYAHGPIGIYAEYISGKPQNCLCTSRLSVSKYKGYAKQFFSWCPLSVTAWLGCHA